MQCLIVPPGATPEWRTLADRVSSLRLRYLDAEGAWTEQWPPRETPAQQLPRAVEFRLVLEDIGELRRVIALPTSLPVKDVGSSGPGEVPSPQPAPGATATPTAPPGSTP